jgi:hypothetical protein
MSTGKKKKSASRNDVVTVDHTASVQKMEAIAIASARSDKGESRWLFRSRTCFPVTVITLVRLVSLDRPPAAASTIDGTRSEAS